MSEILRRMDVYNKSLQSLKADLTMVKTNTQLNISDTTTGSTSYLPKSAQTKNTMYVRIDWVKPVEEQISVIGDRYELFRPRLNQVIQGQTNKAKNSASVGGALGFMSMSKDQLKANYDVVYIGEEQISGGIKTWHLQLNPKAVTTYKTAELWVDPDGTPRQAKITENNGDTTTVLISNIQKNASIKADIFKLAYDKKKVKIIQA
ncbi:MAG TPA: outer-membrane lipoprotein carrier protein LolA [Pyrinomonadaceae bacterium]|nr:outer-membrane lipoprotein carrier protein LolA [Pyrinomonadaceae bacterium]